MSEVDYRRVGGPPTQVQKRPSSSRCNHSFGELNIIMSKLVSFLVYRQDELVYPLDVELCRVSFIVVEVPANTRLVDLVQLPLKVV
jgi:hypothetical protein